MPPRLLNSLIRLPAMASLGSIPQQDMSVLCPRLIKPDDVQICDTGHNDAVRLGIVHRGLARGEGGGSPEPAVGMAEMGDGVGAGVIGGRVGYGHVFFADVDVVLDRVLVLN